MILKTMNLPALDRTAASFAVVKRCLGEPVILGASGDAAVRAILGRQTMTDVTMALALRHDESNRVVDRLFDQSI